MPGLLPVLRRTTAASTSRLSARALSTTAPARGFNKEKEWDMAMDDKEPSQWDEASSVGYMRMIAIDDLRKLVANSWTDAEALRAQARPFTPPKGQIKLTTQLDLAEPKGNVKSVMVAPVSSLPLANEAAVRRFQLLAGPRWTPSPPGRHSDVVAEGSDKNGYIKISEERYKAARMNRKSTSDMLERLVEAANDPKSPIPADAPLDTRHIVARQRKKGGAQTWARRDALSKRPETVGGIKGFPKEWLAPEAQAKVKA